MVWCWNENIYSSFLKITSFNLIFNLFDPFLILQILPKNTQPSLHTLQKPQSSTDTHNLDQSLAGTTLANLKKQRAQSRTSTSDNGPLVSSSKTSTGNPSGNVTNGIATTATSGLATEVSAPPVIKFSGVTSDVVSDSTSRRCCCIM